MALASALAFNTRLSWLDLEGSAIGKEGIRAFSVAMDTNPVLRALQVGAADGDGAASELHALVQRNQEWARSEATRLTAHARWLLERQGAALRTKIREWEGVLRRPPSSP